MGNSDRFHALKTNKEIISLVELLEHGFTPTKSSLWLTPLPPPDFVDPKKAKIAKLNGIKSAFFRLIKVIIHYNGHRSPASSLIPPYRHEGPVVESRP